MDIELKQTQFIELRAVGTSLAKIATKIGVSKPTLISWQKKFETEISNARSLKLKEQRRVSEYRTLKQLGD
jgi:transposase